MAFTRIAKSKQLDELIFEDFIEVKKREPDYLVAGRFTIYQMRVLTNVNDSITNLVFYVIGEIEKQERAIIIFKIDSFYKMIESSSIKRKKGFDSEMCFYLRMFLLTKIREAGKYYIPENVLKEI